MNRSRQRDRGFNTAQTRRDESVEHSIGKRSKSRQADDNNKHKLFTYTSN